METTYQAKRITTKLRSTYEHFIGKLESTLTKLNQEDFKDLENDPEKTKVHLENLAGKQNMIILSSRPHGLLLKLKGIDAKANQYEIGNPLLVLEMTCNNILAALYAPIRLLVYEDADQQAMAEYDLPSATFVQFKDEQVNKVAELLDIMFAKLIQEIDHD